MKFNSFIKECSEKEVFKRLSIYIVSSWVLIQVLSVVYEPLALSEKSVSFLLIALLIGFPFYVYYIWRSKLAPLEHEEDYQSDKKKKKYSKFKSTYFSLMGVTGFICIAFAFYITKNLISDKDIVLAEVESTNKIGILAFNNNTGKPELDVIGKMAADWITHGITENSDDQVISPEIVSDYLSVIKASNNNPDNAGVLKQYFKPGKVILGSYFLNDSTLVIRSSITDGNIDKTLISFQPIRCEQSSPLDCIDELKEKILGFIRNMNNEDLYIEVAPPKFKAYEYKLDAEENLGNPELHLELLNKSIEEDPDYFEPKGLRIAHYYNQGSYSIADSLLNNISVNSKTNDRQLNLLNHYRALLDGNNKRVFETILNEYKFVPSRMPDNSSAMVIAVNFVNRLKGIDTLYNAIDMDDLDFVNCSYCQNRLYMQALAKFSLKEYDKVISLLQPKKQELEYLAQKKLLAASFVHLSKEKDLEQYMSHEKLVLSPTDLLDVQLYIGKHYYLKNNSAKAEEYYSKIAGQKYPDAFKELVGEAKFMLGDYEGAKEQFEKRLSEKSTDINVLSRLATIETKLNNLSLAQKYIDILKGIDKEYSYGSIDYQLAKHYASIDDDKLALEYLLKSIAEGYYYTPNTYDKDPDFKKYFGTPELDHIMTYWH